jgi:hypothetical protein
MRDDARLVEPADRAVFVDEGEAHLYCRGAREVDPADLQRWGVE